MISEGEDHINLDVYDTKDAYKDYIKKCKKKGFDVDYNSSNGMYSAKNKDGYSLDIMYFEEDNSKPEYYSVSINEPKKKKNLNKLLSKQRLLQLASKKQWIVMKNLLMIM